MNSEPDNGQERNAFISDTSNLEFPLEFLKKRRCRVWEIGQENGNQHRSYCVNANVERRMELRYGPKNLINLSPHTRDFSRELGDRTFEPIRSCINSQKTK